MNLCSGYDTYLDGILIRNETGQIGYFKLCKYESCFVYDGVL